MVHPRTKVVFLQTNSPQEKIHKMLKIIYEHYTAKKYLFLKVETEETLTYLDKLLWGYPKDSFLPHNSTNSFILIGLNASIPSHVSSIFNLTNAPYLENVSRIFEIEDLSSPQKKKIYTEKYDTYASLGYHVISS